MSTEENKRNEFLFVKRQDLKEELRLTVIEVMAEFKEEKVWITAETTKNMLSIKSDTTLQMLRNTGKITFSQPLKKLILYKKASVLEYLEKHSHKPF